MIFRVLSLMVFGWTSCAMAGLTLPSFFSDHMVLQQQQEVAIWGTADPESEIKLTFKGNSATTKAGADGKWKASIKSGAADAAGASLMVASGTDSVTINDVLVGEVWLASGQSNMAWTVAKSKFSPEEVAGATHPGLRMFNAPMVTAVDPQDDIAGEWSLCSPETVSGYSGVAFFFARKLHRDLGIPVGVIKSAWGGKPVETFTSREALNSIPETKALVDTALKRDRSFDMEAAQKLYDARVAAHEKAMLAWKDASKQGKKGRRLRRPRLPVPPRRPLETEGVPGVLFNSMIHPFVGYTIRGTIWYQGESNARFGQVPYDVSLPLMIRDWRKRWGSDFDFNFVQLANYRPATADPGQQDPWPLLQDRQRKILSTTPKTGMAIINDVGEVRNVHPPNKKTPGERLARWALNKTYGKDVLHSGPLFKGHTVKGSDVHVSFEAAGSGLKSRDDQPLKRFEIAGEDRVWKWADAKIASKDTVVVSHADLKAPVAVRYAWASNPEGANLVNSEGLPTSVFRTDDWNDVVDEKALIALAAADELKALMVQVRELTKKRNALERGSEDYKKVGSEISELLKKRQKLAPKKSRPEPKKPQGLAPKK